jgi:NAD(P)H-dependent FMN reductase
VIPAAVPQFDSFTHVHSIVWSSKILKYDGFVLVTTCYNNGPPGGVKNALDYLYHEVQGKPFMVVSYGIQGGGSAAEALKLNLETMGAKVVETRLALKFSEKGERR